MVLLITYDLVSKPKEQYADLYKELTKANFWWHYLESTWLVATDMSPADWYSKLLSSITQNDRLLIIEVKPNYYGWLSKEAWDWIKAHLG